MKKKLSRSAAALTAAVLALALLAGCASGEKPPEQSHSTQSPAVSEPADTPTPGADPSASPEPAATPEPTSAVTPEPSLEPTPEPSLEPTPEPSPDPTPEPSSEPTPEPSPEPSPQGPEDGNYTANVTLAGGTGRATIQSPAALRCVDGQFFATIAWSSPNFDYMKVDGVRCELISAPGENSVFEIPVPWLDRPFTVIADTIAMSEPHEVEYTLTFDSASLAKQ